MSCRTSHSIALFLILVSLIGCANAAPEYGNDAFIGMDWSLIGSVGEQFSEAMAHNQFSQMTSSPTIIPTSRRRRRTTSNRSEPTSHPYAACPTSTVADPFEPIPLWGMAMPNSAGLGIQDMQGQVQSVNSHGNPGQFAIPRQVLPSDYYQIPSASQQFQRGRMDCQEPVSLYGSSAPQQMAPALSQDVFGAVENMQDTDFMAHSFPPHQSACRAWSLDADAMSDAPLYPYSIHQYPVAPGDSGPSDMTPFYNTNSFPFEVPSDQPGELMPADVAVNYSYQNAMYPNDNGMLGWINRAPLSSYGAPPRLTTDHLMDHNRLSVPESISDTRSPTSTSTSNSFTGRRASRRRAGTTTAGANLRCLYCSATAPTAGDLMHHLRSHTPYMSRNHVCPHCEKRFQFRKDLARHLPKHDPNRPRFYCPIDNCKYHTKGFGRQDHLDRHLGTQHRVEQLPKQREDTPLRES